MYDIDFYEDEHGNSEVKAFINDLREKSETSKDAKINFNKVIAYIDMLEEMGTHHFLKKTQKTPKREIDKAKREIEDYKRREGKK